MKKLILVRHSNAESGSFSTPDIKRRLTPTGKNRAVLQAKRLMNKQIIPDCILSSSATRAKETTEVFVGVFNSDVKTIYHDFLYEDFTTTEFIDLIKSIPSGCNSALIMGHNPTISLMAAQLDADAMISFAPCTMVVLNTPDDWKETEVDNCKIIDLLQP